jgi:hypothetical protein
VDEALELEVGRGRKTRDLFERQLARQNGARDAERLRHARAFTR